MYSNAGYELYRALGGKRSIAEWKSAAYKIKEDMYGRPITVRVHGNEIHFSGGEFNDRSFKTGAEAKRVATRMAARYKLLVKIGGLTFIAPKGKLITLI